MMTLLLERGAKRGRQRGVVLIYALIAMVLIMLATIALVRGIGTATNLSGAFGMRHDLVNQGDRGVSCALASLGSTTNTCNLASVTNALSAAATRNADLKAANYHATALAVDSKTGIPSTLLDTDTNFNAVNGAGDISDTTDGTAYGVTIRYVIDRLCNTAGAPTPATCVANNRTGDKGGTNWLPKAGTTFQPIYRVSVRVTFPSKNTMTFVQMMVGAS